MKRTAILLAILSLTVSANCEYRLTRMGTKEMCLTDVNHIVLESMPENCVETECHLNGATYMTTTCDESVGSFNESLIQYGAGKNFTIGWYYTGPTCTDVNAIEAKEVTSCEGAASFVCQNGQTKFCSYIQPHAPQTVPPITVGTPVPAVTPPIHQQDPPIAPLTEPSAPSPVEPPVVQQLSPTAVPSDERPLTTFEKLVVGFSMGGWAVAVLFVILYIYQRQQTKSHNYEPLIEEHDPEPPNQPTVITSDNKNAFKPILQENKSRMQSIPPSELIIDKTKKLGEGQACNVYQGFWRQKKVAIKIPRDRDAAKLMKELTVFSEIEPHPNIIEVFGYFEYEDRLCIVLELCNCPNLEQLAKKELPISDKFNIAMGIAAGMLHLHHAKRQVIHRDLKPGNILVTRSGTHLIPKIADFDYSRLLASPTGVTYSTPTTSYAAPEQLAASATARKQYSVKSDVWAYGATLFYLLTGQTPFAVQNSSALKTQRLNKQALVRFELLDALPTDPFTALMVDITRKCLNDDPTKRPAFDRIDSEFVDFFNKFYPHTGNNNNDI